VARFTFANGGAAMAETWYILTNGAFVHPDEVAPDDSGALVHSSGVHVAMRGNVPSTRSMYPADIEAQSVTREIVAEPKKHGYVTRKAR